MIDYSKLITEYIDTHNITDKKSIQTFINYTQMSNTPITAWIELYEYLAPCISHDKNNDLYPFIIYCMKKENII